ncbi:DUF262 domain-containing protein [Acinetobacter baumannii]|nr:DUF262 domain-containing protein [Acinetobacter baumannii]
MSENNDLFDEDNEEILHPFDPSLINLSSSVQSVYTLMQRMKHNEMVKPSYQRQDDVWTKEVKSRLIESLLVRIPLPIFYIDASEDDKWKIVDGLQRLTALKEFTVDKSFKLEGLEYLGTDLNGFGFDDLPRSFQRRIEETDVTVIQIKKGTPDSVKFNIFKRINTGGEPLSDQEIRHALNDGAASVILNKICLDKRFIKIFGEDNKRMQLHETALRGISYFFLDQSYWGNDLDTYLINAMKEINKQYEKSADLVEIKVKKYLNVLKVCDSLFDEYVFRKFSLNGSTRKNPLNINVYEAWMSVLYNKDSEIMENLIENKEELVDKFSKLFLDKSFGYLMSSRKLNSIKSRSLILNQLIEEIVK